METEIRLLIGQGEVLCPSCNGRLVDDIVQGKAVKKCVSENLIFFVNLKIIEKKDDKIVFV